jgi:hypothetical protein
LGQMSLEEFITHFKAEVQGTMATFGA